jgi:hypothetical protein
VAAAVVKPVKAAAVGTTKAAAGTVEEVVKPISDGL